MRYTLVIFDLDGTLADSFPWFIGSLNTVADAFRLRRVGEDEIEPLRRADVPEILKHLGVPRWKLPMIARYMRKLKSTELHTISLFPGVEDMLRTLKAGGVTLTLVSSDNEENAKVVLGPDNAALFSQYNCSAALFGKAGKFRRVMRRAGVEPHRVLAIGDEARDLNAARAAGIDFAAVTWGYTAPEKLRTFNPDIVFERIEDIGAKLLP
ncbi:HAD hydrolase-like protein [Hyphomicrobium sp.]|uniref:HAD hydrolase-like protein n=1 Tax=Hyphomicrobium sp. TaxID=82 RepID=UPI000F9C7AB9|nr:HAD hydrolase-like protein [Hyphomicrobium sp.]RUP00642.1 MAG: HAD family hydrolase [Hyphomicrobium sp.]